MARRLTPNEIEACNALVHTSVDDCRSSLYGRTEPAVLEAAIEMAEKLGHKTRVTLLRRKLKQIKRDTGICIFCECTDLNACVAIAGDVCSWYLLDQKLKKGVCTRCADSIRHFAFCAEGLLKLKPGFNSHEISLDDDNIQKIASWLKWFANLSGKLPRK